MKIVYISSMLPSGHFSQYITEGLSQINNFELIIYTDKNKNNLLIKNCGQIKVVWSKSFKYIFEIYKELKKDKPDLVHVQQELNMYGGILTVLLFPILLILIKLLKIKLVITIHGAVYKKQINDEFVKTFNKNPRFFKPFIIKYLFNYTFFACSVLADKIIAHNLLMKKILCEDYLINSKKVKIIKTPVPKKNINNKNKENYFFYFGYMVRRKGLQHVLTGFKKFIDKYPKSGFKLKLAGGVIKGQEKSLEEIKQFVKNNQLVDDVEMLGFIEEQVQDKLYQKALAVVIPAVISLGSGGPLYHALSYGKCIIASKIGHFLYDLEDQKTAFLTDNNQWDKTFELVINNKKLVANIENKVEELIKKRYPKQTGLKYMSLYQEILNL